MKNNGLLFEVEKVKKEQQDCLRCPTIDPLCGPSRHQDSPAKVSRRTSHTVAALSRTRHASAGLRLLTVRPFRAATVTERTRTRNREYSDLCKQALASCTKESDANEASLLRTLFGAPQPVRERGADQVALLWSLHISAEIPALARRVAVPQKAQVANRAGLNLPRGMLPPPWPPRTTDSSV